MQNSFVKNTDVSIADGYGFPTHLEKDIPEGEVCPKTMQKIVYEDAVAGVELAEVMKKVALKNSYRIDE